MKKKNLPLIIHLLSIFLVIPCYLIGILFHIVGGTFKTFGYLFQFDINEAADVWTDIYYDIKNLKY